MCEPGTIFLSHLLKTTLLEDLRVVAVETMPVSSGSNAKGSKTTVYRR